MELWTEKYAPKRLEDIVGNDAARRKIKVWLLSWLHGEPQKPVLVYGPPGTGKTCTAQALANQFNLELVQTNPSELCDASHLYKKIGMASMNASLLGKKKLLLIDDVDAFQREDRGGIAEVIRLIKQAQWPIFITAEDAWNRKIASLRPHVVCVEYKRISPSSVIKVLERIVEGEGLAVSKEVLKEIAINCDGDVRAAIFDLYTRRPGIRDRDEDIFARMRTVFKTMDMAKARSISWLIDHDYLKLWIEENIPHEYSFAIDCARAFDVLSRADIFDGRIRRRQYWRLLRYSSDLMTCGVALAKRQPYHKFTRYQFPSYLRVMSASMAKRAMQRAVGKKIGAKTHCTWKQGLEYLGVMKALIKAHPVEVCELFEFTEAECAFILGTTSTEVKRMMKQAKAASVKKPSKAKPKQKSKPLAKRGNGTENAKPTDPTEPREEKKSSGLSDFLL